MLACVQKETFKQVDEVQKSLMLGDILKSEVTYFKDKETALENGCVPLSFITIMRTAYSNLVVEHETENGVRYYTSILLDTVSELPHKGYDLVMFSTSLGVSQCIDLSKPENNELMMKSQFEPLGVYLPDVGVFNPMIVSNVVFSDSVLETLQNALRDGFSLVPIKDMQRTGNLSKILSEIIEVKEEK